MQKTIMPTTKRILEKIQLYWLRFFLDKLCELPPLRCKIVEKCPSETGTEGCQVACWHLPRHFQKILLTQQWFALTTESQTYGFKQSLSQWLILSQLSDYIKLCNPGCCCGASDNSSLYGVRRRWDLLGVPLCAPGICLKSVTLGESGFLP